MNRTVCIIGIGERSSLVNQRIQSEMDREDAERVQLLTIDYSRDENQDFASADHLQYLVDRTIGLILYRLSNFQNTTDLAKWNEDGLPSHLCNPLDKQIDTMIDMISKYNVSTTNKIPRIIVHACLNQDHPKGIQNAVGEYYNSHSPKNKQPEGDAQTGQNWSDFSRLIFFEVIRILESAAKKRKVKIDIFPVVLLRTSFYKKEDAIHKERLVTLIEKLGRETEKNSFFKIGYLIQDTNSRGNSINIFEHISLLYLHLLVLANITNSVKELGIWNDIRIRNVLFETSPIRDEERWCSLGFVDGVLQFKTYKTKFAKFLVKESLEYILKDEETNASLSRREDSVYSSVTPQLQLESIFLSLLNTSEDNSEATSEKTIQRFHDKVNSHDEVYKKQIQNHNLEDIPSGQGDNRKFSDYLNLLENLPMKDGKKSLEIRELPEYWKGLVNQSKGYILRIREMTKDFLQPTRMREMDAHVKNITIQTIHDFRLFCSIIASGDPFKPDNQEFYNKELDRVVNQFFASTKPNYTWKYLRESLRKAFRIFQYDIYNPSLSKVNESVKKVEELKNYDLTEVFEAIEKNKTEIERIPSKKAIFLFIGILIGGLALTNLRYLSPLSYVPIHGIIGKFSYWIIDRFFPSSGFYLFGMNFQFQDFLTMGILTLLWIGLTGGIILYYRGRLFQYKEGIETQVKIYRHKVKSLYKEMFGINLNLKLSGFLMEYINEIEKSFIKLNDFESKSRELIRNLEHSLTELYGSVDDMETISRENLNTASFMGLNLHPQQEQNTILVSLLHLNLQDTLINIRNSIQYQVDDTNLIKKYLLRFDRSIEESFQEFQYHLEKEMRFDSIETLSKDWRFTKTPPNVQSYIPLKIYTSDFELHQFPMREHKELTIGDMNELNTYEDYHILTIFYPFRKFTFKELQFDLLNDIHKGYQDEQDESKEGKYEEVR